MSPPLAPLCADQHAGLQLQQASGYGFARDMLLAPIVLDELAEAAREYAIVFPRGATLPCVLLGVQEGCNAYVAADGRWQARYIPAHLRHQPFALGPPGPGGQPGLLADLASPLLGTAPGQALFDGRGQPAPVLQAAIELMQALQARQALTLALVHAIDQAGVLVERTVEIRHADGDIQRVAGLRVVNETALNALDAPAFDRLRRAGALPLVYAQLLSFANLRLGPIGKAHPLPSTAGLHDLPADSPWLPEPA